MRPLFLLLPLFAACVDFNRGPELDDLVTQFLSEEDLAEADLLDCGGISADGCAEEPEAAEAARTCLTDALAACTPAKLEHYSRNGDGVESRMVYVVHAEADGCAVEVFGATPDGTRQVLSEDACGGLSFPEDDTCAAADTTECTEVCGGWEADKCWWPS